MDLRGIPHHDRQADAQPGAARHGLPQTLRPAAPPRSDRPLSASERGGSQPVGRPDSLRRRRDEAGIRHRSRRSGRLAGSRRHSRRSRQDSRSRSWRSCRQGSHRSRLGSHSHRSRLGSHSHRSRPDAIARAKPPRPQPQPRQACAGVGVATVATAKVPASTNAVRGRFMMFPPGQCLPMCCRFVRRRSLCSR
jgi:hypothetical protein